MLWLQSTPVQKKILTNLWELKARESQLEPLGRWNTWLLCCGRGYGKTLTGAQTVRSFVETGRARNIALIGATSSDVRDIMILGKSGIMNVCPSYNKPNYEPTKRRLTWKNGAAAIGFSAENPEDLRGHELDLVWIDEICKMRYVDEVWDMMKFCMRSELSNKVIVTTTPKPMPLIKKLINDKTCFVTTGSTFENDSLPKEFIEHITDKYGGTRLGRQELFAEILTDNQNALWTREHIEDFRVNKAPNLVRIVVAIDPSITNKKDSDETGIIVAGIDDSGHGYLLEDGSMKGTPLQWAKRAINLYHKYEANLIVAEANQGGDMIEQTLRTIDNNIPFKKVHASRNKQTRAEPISSKYEQGKIHHVGYFAEVEDQMCEWEVGEKSPDRMDALVWAFTELMPDKEERPIWIARV
ncbi:ATP-binding protein [Bacillus sp. AFS077874]|nr:ATP-binding protein [Bacillus sp. AFS077874]